MLAVLCTIFAILVVFCLWVMLYDTHHFVTVKYQFSSGLLKQPTRLIMISDLHNYQYGPGNCQLFAAIEEARPDMILIAGDVITAAPNEKIDKTMDFLKQLKERYPIYYAYGNHEQKISLYKSYKDMGERFEKELVQIGIKPLRNTHVTLEERGLAIYGLEIDHAYYKRLSTEALPDHYPEKLLGRPKEDTYTVLLAHNPEFFSEYAGWGADLVLSGHTHGGVIRVPFLGGLVSPSLHLFPKYDGGLFTEGKTSMVIGRGLGTHTPKVRLFNPAELVLVDLSPESTGEESK
ncbi:MAG: metallophosphoesterase [Lachnospiraceae bacterium]|nr:metallophosphoesterase [Lachnospiraceae bacterium]